MQAQGAQGPHSADTQDDFLLDAGVDVATVQLIGNGAIHRAVVRNIAVEKEHANMAGLGLPNLERDPPVGDSDVNVQFLAGAVARGLQGQVGECGRRVVGDLFALPVNGLIEVALTIQHAHGHERNRKVAGGLAVIPRQNAQAAGIDGQALVQAEFGAEIGNQVLAGVQVRSDDAPCMFLMVGVVGRQGAVEVLDEDPVFRRLVEAVLGDAPQKDFGVVAALLPQFFIKTDEQAAYPPVPTI